MSELDKFFATMSTDELVNGISEGQFERDRTAGKNDPRAFYHKSNLLNKDLRDKLCECASIPADSPGGENVRKVAGQLLGEFAGDIELISSAIHNLRLNGDLLPGGNIYYMKKAIVNKASYLRAYSKRDYMSGYEE